MTLDVQSFIYISDTILYGLTTDMFSPLTGIERTGFQQIQQREKRDSNPCDQREKIQRQQQNQRTKRNTTESPEPR